MAAAEHDTETLREPGFGLTLLVCHTCGVRFLGEEDHARFVEESA